MNDKVVKFNKNAYFILPLIGLTTNSYGENAFINSYVTLDRVIILKLVVPEHTEPLVKEYLVGAWVNDEHSMVAYQIPEEFYNEFDAFLEGRYSDFSEKAFNKISQSIPSEIVEISEGELDNDLIKYYMNKMHEARHPIQYNIVGDTIITLKPTYLGAIAPKNHPSRESLKLALEQKLDMELPEGAELYDKIDFEQELLTPNMLIDEGKFD